MPKDKAPGPDGLDDRILNLFYKLDPTKMLQLYNKCIMMGSFPTSFKYGEVILFNKPNKDPTIPSSYRPITLLPILGKCFEKLILNRLQFHYNSNNLIRKNQFGFRSGLSTEHALHNLVKKIYSNKARNFYTIIISIDIKGEHLTHCGGLLS
ncbi:uncharacterized protein CEXT_209651 [Caerostris extrusa]|uniref:Reverse transcriptase domain-containing protein n=1 Tax=Caerostris extrusa TaxID=172846 RepID=A0AAV4PHZ3_CAEEX|nr:uncharacterized protein CEXT_209651 [Caerostris extrusa]